MNTQAVDASGQKPKTLRERILYAILFEVLGIALSSPLAAYFMDRAVEEMGVVTLTLALMALAWNVLFNFVFDRLLLRFGLRKGTAARIVHACCFEFGLFACAVPFSMWYLEVGFFEAVTLDIGLTAFYLPYTYLFGLIYDWIRGKYWGKPEKQPAGASDQPSP